MVKKTASENIEEDEITMDIDEPEMTIEDLPGVGPATVKNLERLDSKNYWLYCDESNGTGRTSRLGEAVSSKIIQAAKTSKYWSSLVVMHY